MDLQIQQAYIAALREELGRARNAEHAAEVKAELARVGAPVEEIVETAAAAPMVETAAVPKRKAAPKK